MQKVTTINSAKRSHWSGSLKRIWGFSCQSRLAMTGIVMIVFFVIVGLLAPVIAPFDAMEKSYNADRKLERLQSPSVKHPFGTTLYGRDVFSQLLFGTRTVLMVGFLTAFFVALLGMNVGLFSGYYGGWVDNLLMRITDVLFGVPLLPFAIVALSIVTRNMLWIITIMSLLYWMGTARVVRSQVSQGAPVHRRRQNVGGRKPAYYLQTHRPQCAAPGIRPRRLLRCLGHYHRGQYFVFGFR